MSWPSRDVIRRTLPWLLPALLVVAALALAGLKLDRRSFAGNLAAEGIGVAISVLVALTLVEYLLRRERRHQWERVRGHTLRALYSHLVEIVVHFCLRPGTSGEWRVHAPLDDYVALTQALVDAGAKASPGRGWRPTAALTQAMAEIAEHVRWWAAGVEETDPDAAVELQRLHERVGPNVAAIQDVVTPRIIALADDHGLVERLVALEGQGRLWSFAMRARGDDPEAMLVQEAWRPAASTLDATVEVARYVADRYSARFPSE